MVARASPVRAPEAACLRAHWRLTLPALAVASLALPRAARADAEEASIRLDLGPAAVRVADPLGQGATDTVPGVHVGVRASYAPGDYRTLGDYWAVEIGAALLAGNGATHPGLQVSDGEIRTLVHDERAVRLTAGLAARLGVSWIPTVTVLAGWQHRFLTGIVEQDPSTGLGTARRPAASADDLLAGLAIGLEHRLDAHWILGLSLQLVHGFNVGGPDFDALELPAGGAWYFYPRLDQ